VRTKELIDIEKFHFLVLEESNYNKKPKTNISQLTAFYEKDFQLFNALNDIILVLSIFLREKFTGQFFKKRKFVTHFSYGFRSPV